MRRFLSTAVASTLLAAAAPALAAPTACSADSHTLQCRLASVLHLLYGVAAILAVILLICLIFAVRVYRRNRASSNRQTPSS